MKKAIFPVIIIMLMLTSCGGSDSGAGLDATFDSSITKGTINNIQQVADTLSAKPDTSMISTTLNTVQPVAGQPAVVAPVATAPTQAGMNPAHGQPGHRCDIAVGAPLNSKPATTTTQPTVTTTTQPTVTTTPAKTAPGMNPAHGQPGHRCDIAVGAPLNSKPAAVSPEAKKPESTTAPAVAAETAPASDSSKK